MIQGHHEPCSEEEYDAVTAARRGLSWAPGERKVIKRRLNRKARQMGRREVRQEAERVLDGEGMRTMVDIEDVREALTGVEIIFRAVRATGGHLYRKQFQATDREMDTLVERSELQIRTVVVESMVAKELLKDLGQEQEFGRRLEELGRRMAAEPKA